MPIKFNHNFLMSICEHLESDDLMRPAIAARCHPAGTLPLHAAQDVGSWDLICCGLFNRTNNWTQSWAQSTMFSYSLHAQPFQPCQTNLIFMQIESIVNRFENTFQILIYICKRVGFTMGTASFNIIPATLNIQDRRIQFYIHVFTLNVSIVLWELQPLKAQALSPNILSLILH